MQGKLTLQSTLEPDAHLSFHNLQSMTNLYASINGWFGEVTYDAFLPFFISGFWTVEKT